ncbi:MAG: biphenyl 2,3-dioxygenase [Gemmatimonadales bacterium]|nr:biphenyl 2,3-dioxygenase [Gemmatimonadales bacterium]
MRLRALALLTGAILMAACGGDNGGQGPPGNDDPPDGNVEVRNNLFDPSSLEVTSGSPVTWTWNSGGVTHNVTFDDGNSPSGDKSSGTHQRTFAAAGSFPYHCTIHGLGMSGVVTVATAQSPGTGNPPPQGPGY